MGREIERKFLLSKDVCTGRDDGVEYVQGYIFGAANRPLRLRSGQRFGSAQGPDAEKCVVRIRIMGAQAVITVKSRLYDEGIERLEYEYPIPVEDAAEMLELICGKPLIEKTRYKIVHAEKEWDVDCFHGVNDGLLLAEIELDTEDEAVELPPWVGEEVTDDARYLNVNLSKNPFMKWKEK